MRRGFDGRVPRDCFHVSCRGMEGMSGGPVISTEGAFAMVSGGWPVCMSAKRYILGVTAISMDTCKLVLQRHLRIHDEVRQQLLIFLISTSNTTNVLPGRVLTLVPCAFFRVCPWSSWWPWSHVYFDQPIPIPCWFWSTNTHRIFLTLLLDLLGELANVPVVRTKFKFCSMAEFCIGML